MTESMIERGAIAIMAARDEGGDAWAQARAVIEAMREPTTAMWRRVFDEDLPSLPNEDFSTYQALIDAALIWPAGSADRAGVPLARD